jgi:UDP-3-O-[3-hydroxymyristoyl] glucosamine N-acyltransferase
MDRTSVEAAHPGWRVDLLLGIFRSLSGSLAIGDAVALILASARDLLDFDRVEVLGEEDPDTLLVRSPALGVDWRECRRVGRGDCSQRYWPKPETFERIAESTRELDASFEIDREIMERGTRSLLRVALTARHQPFGLLEFSSSRSSAFDEQSVHAGSAIAGLVTIALEREHRHAAEARWQRRMAEIDALLPRLSALRDPDEIVSLLRSLDPATIPHDLAAVIVAAPGGAGVRAVNQDLDFSPTRKTYPLGELATLLKGQVVGDGSIEIRGVSGIREATPGDITFLANARYESYLSETRASAVICTREQRVAQVPLLLVENPYLAFQQAVSLFGHRRLRPPPGVHPTAAVSPEAIIGKGTSIGAHCVVEAGVHIGERAVLLGGCYIGSQAVLGDDTFLYPNAVVREACIVGARCILHPGVVVGSDGFGFTLDAGRYHKVPQVGNVVIGDDVEIGANTTIDRATMDSTRIGDGTKIDNLVQIGHNVLIGKHCIIVAQVGICGSTRLEDFVTLGGQAGLAGHIRIGERAMVGGQSGVTKSIPSGEVWSGYPAVPHGLWKRLAAMVQKLPQLFQRARTLEERLERLEMLQSTPKTR